MSKNLLGLVVDQISPREIELKFDLSREEATEILTQPLWRQSGHLETRTLNSVYYDTPDRLLMQAGYSLRIREEDGKRIQTIKTIAAIGSSLTDRGEWSCQVRGKKPNVRARAAAAIRPILENMKQGDTLEAIFSVAVERHAVKMDFNGAKIEAVVDHGELLAGDRQRFYELELELLAGDKEALFALAFHMFRTTPLRLNMLSKAERGFTHLVGGLSPVRAERLDLAADLTPEAAFQSIARSCLRHLLANIAAFSRDATPDAVHQARVAMRRLRAAIGLFRAVVDDRLRGPINAELRSIAQELGAARSLDVYITGVLLPAVKFHGADPDFSRLLAEHELRRERAYQAAADLLRSPRFGYAVLTVAHWIECGQWLRDREAEQQQQTSSRTVVELASRQLSRSWKKVRREAKRREFHTDEERHEWRIEIKKLRYACEFFSSLFDDGSNREVRRRVSRRLSSLQDNLGELNDIAETRGMNPLSETAAKLQDAREEKRVALMQSVDHDVSVLRKIMPFWKPRKSETVPDS